MHNESKLLRVGEILRNAREDERGMSLIEIMVVLTIIGLVTSVIGVAVLGSLEDAKIDTTRTQMKNLQSALMQYKIANGRYPTSSEGLDALINPPPSAKKKRPFLQGDSVPGDAWDSDFIYYSPGTHGNHDFEIISYGADSAAGGDGVDADINSWELQ